MRESSSDWRTALHQQRAFKLFNYSFLCSLKKKNCYIVTTRLFLICHFHIPGVTRLVQRSTLLGVFQFFSHGFWSSVLLIFILVEWKKTMGSWCIDVSTSWEGEEGLVLAQWPFPTELYIFDKWISLSLESSLKRQKFKKHILSVMGF